ncbi:DNA cytosine methyltransferase [Serratia marcescens]|nr:DNA cytosine methyltransferase [Serratia marcescens]EJC6391927.1 DNA cytosine methyltransferase [Serratia marcescens]
MNVTVNSYFCRAGLMDIGLMDAGIEVNQAFELDADACKTYRHNLGDHVKQYDISKELVFEQDTYDGRFSRTHAQNTRRSAISTACALMMICSCMPCITSRWQNLNFT